ncbi:MAG: protein phosphatase 2C domain-containing protein [Oscillospiraceae bacterium]|nr:protein phosphatase 2C domain-containing protein [Oscillospiraceae bacterium]
MNFIVTASTDIGLTKATNQDSLNARVYATTRGRLAFAVLCDGMGGLSKGEVASASVVRAFVKWADTRLADLSRGEIADSDIRNDWVDIVTTYNQKIQEYGILNGIDLGTTVTALLLTKDRYYIINVGDTRAYEITDRVMMLTKDQTLVAREVELGLLTDEEARVDSRKNILLQCVGASDDLYPDLFFGDTKVNAVYMLCSDGFRHEITTDEIFENLNPGVMIDSEGMRDNVEALIEMNKQRHERDNITAIAIRTF